MTLNRLIAQLQDRGLIYRSDGPNRQTYSPFQVFSPENFCETIFAKTAVI